MSLNICCCFFELLEEFPKNEFELAMVNESSVFESLRIYRILYLLERSMKGPDGKPLKVGKEAATSISYSLP